jgi:hypothetical protein
MIFEFFKSYGGLLSLIMLILGWFVLLNSTKYITSRNEAKSFVNDLTCLLEKAFKESIDFWSDFTNKTNEERNAFYKKNELTIHQIKDYRNLLINYDIYILSAKNIKMIKDNLTLSPESKIIQDIKEDPDKHPFIKSKISMAHREGNKYILSVHKTFIEKYIPTKKPLIDNIFKLNFITGLIYGVIIIFIYFFIGDSLLN